MEFVGGLASDRGVVLSRVWWRQDATSLRLVASSGTPAGGGSYNRIDGAFAVIEIGAGKIGAIAETGASQTVRGLRGDEDWLANREWAARQGVKSFVGLPLLDNGRVCGVFALFDRRVLSDDHLTDLRFVVELAAARLAALAATRATRHVDTAGPARDVGADTVMTRAEVRRLEKRNIEIALTASHGKIFGDGGAAQLLKMRPTTLASRIKALGIRMR